MIINILSQIVLTLESWFLPKAFAEHKAAASPPLGGQAGRCGSPLRREDVVRTVSLLISITSLDIDLIEILKDAFVTLVVELAGDVVSAGATFWNNGVITFDLGMILPNKGKKRVLLFIQKINNFGRKGEIYEILSSD